MLQVRTPQKRYASEYDSLQNNQQLVVEEYDVVCGCLPPLLAGGVVCFLTLVEGFFVIFHVTGVIDSKFGWFHELDENWTEWRLLTILGIGDMIAVALGALGLCVWGSIILPAEVLAYASSSGRSLVGFLLGWRAVVIFAAAPCVGAVMASKPEGYDLTKPALTTFFFFAMNAIVLLMMIPAYHGAGMDYQRLQREADLQGVEIHQMFAPELQGQAPRGSSLDPSFLDSLHHESSISGHALVVFVACLVALLSGRTVGGWAFLSQKPVQVPLTFPLEKSVYLGSCLAAIIGLLGMISFRSASQRQEVPSSRSTDARHSDDAVEAMLIRRRSASVVLLYFVASALRCALFVPITIMSVVARNTCGIYVHALASLSLRVSTLSMPPLHCSFADLGNVSMVVIVTLMDVYMVLGLFRLWRQYRLALGFEDTRTIGAPKMSVYGSQPPVLVVL